MGSEAINGQLEMGVGGVNTRHRPINGGIDRAHTFLLYCFAKTAICFIGERNCIKAVDIENWTTQLF